MNDFVASIYAEYDWTLDVIREDDNDAFVSCVGKCGCELVTDKVNPLAKLCGSCWSDAVVSKSKQVSA